MFCPTYSTCNSTTLCATCSSASCKFEPSSHPPASSSTVLWICWTSCIKRSSTSSTSTSCTSSPTVCADVSKFIGFRLQLEIFHNQLYKEPNSLCRCLQIHWLRVQLEIFQHFLQQLANLLLTHLQNLWFKTCTIFHPKLLSMIQLRIF